MKISLLINMKMPTIIGIFIFINRENFMHKKKIISRGQDLHCLLRPMSVPKLRLNTVRGFLMLHFIFCYYLQQNNNKLYSKSRELSTFVSIM